MPCACRRRSGSRGTERTSSPPLPRDTAPLPPARSLIAPQAYRAEAARIRRTRYAGRCSSSRRSSIDPLTDRVDRRLIEGLPAERHTAARDAGVTLELAHDVAAGRVARRHALHAGLLDTRDAHEGCPARGHVR